MSRPAVYVELANKLRVTFRALRPGWEVPPVPNLAREHGLSENTVRKALAVLEKQEIITRQSRTMRYRLQSSANQPVMAKPYPAVAVYVHPWNQLASSDYSSLLVAALIDEIRRQGVDVCIPSDPSRTGILPAGGGAALTRPETRVSGAAILSGWPESFIDQFIRCDAVAMTLDGLATNPAVDSVAVDCEQDGANAVAYLHRLGHRTIGLLAWRESLPVEGWTNRTDPDVKRLARGISEGKQRLNLLDHSAYEIIYDKDPPGDTSNLRQAINSLWRLSPHPTAIICYDSSIIAATRFIMAERGIQCPRDVSLMARGPVTEATAPITLLASDPAAMGRAGGQHMVRRLSEADTKPSRLLFPSTIHEGATTGPIQGG